MQPLKPALQFSQGRSFNWSGAVLVNCFAEKADGDKTEDFAVIPSPGLTPWLTIGSAPLRGAIMCNGVLYVVCGGTAYSVGSDGTYTSLGTIGGTGLVRMAANTTQVAIAAAGVGYVISGGVVSTPVPFSVSDVTFIDGYILWTIAGTDQFTISSLDDALTYDASQVAAAEGAPDALVGVMNSHREILLAGADTHEIFYNSGAANMPIERQGNAFIERGCFDRDSMVKMDNTYYFMGDDRIVYVLNGYQPQRISTHPIEYHLRNATYARAFTYSQEGHKFYCLTVDDGTFCFDPSTGAWHQRKSYGLTYWRPWGAVQAYGRTLLLDSMEGKLFTPSPDVFTDDGDPVVMDITLPTLEYGRERVTMHAFEVTIETGPGDSTTPDPKVILTYSDDGGHRWSNEIWRTMGKVGEYRHRAIWRKLGQFRVRQMRLQFPDPVRRLVIAYWANIL